MYGTTGELIKLSPILRLLSDIGEPAFTVFTGQQAAQVPPLLDDFGLPQPDLSLWGAGDARDLERPRDLPRWLSRVMLALSRRGADLRRRLAAGDTKPVVVVHGDTLTTVLGALTGRALRVPVAHVEAGMRSGDWRNPFPEELDRLAAARLARVHFAPGPDAVAHLRAMKVRGAIVDTGGNTIRDALDSVEPRAPGVELPAQPFGLVSLHRFELLGRPATLRAILELLREASRSTPMLFVDHPVTAAAIAEHGLAGLFDEDFRCVPRLRYLSFIALLKASRFLITDSGGAQQECAQLGHPCLVHRALTEHRIRPHDSVVLSRMDLDTVRAFLAEPATWRRRPATSERRPTDVIVDYLVRHGYVGGGRR